MRRPYGFGWAHAWLRLRLVVLLAVPCPGCLGYDALGGGTGRDHLQGGRVNDACLEGEALRSC